MARTAPSGRFFMRRIPPRTTDPASSSSVGKVGNAERADSRVGSPANTPDAATHDSVRPRPSPSRRRRNWSRVSSSDAGSVLMNGSNPARSLAVHGAMGAATALGDAGIWTSRRPA